MKGKKEEDGDVANVVEVNAGAVRKPGSIIMWSSVKTEDSRMLAFKV